MATHQHTVLYRSDLVVGIGPPASDAAADAGLVALGDTDNATVLDLLVDVLDPEERNAFVGVEDEVQAMINDADLRFFGMTDGVNLEEVIRHPTGELRPIHAISFQPHWGFGPGTEPFDTDRPMVDPHNGDFGPAGEEIWVGAIDTGVWAAEDLGGWVAGRVVPADPQLDVEEGHHYDGSPTVSGHGTFVASVIAAQDPRLRVAMARLPAVDKAKLIEVVIESEEDDDPAPGTPGNQDDPPPADPEPCACEPHGDDPVMTDEIQLMPAVLRLLGLDVAGSFKAINLSLGVYTEPDAVPLAGNTALQKLIDGHLPVVAAGGNLKECHGKCRTEDEVVWPGKRHDVIGVQSSDEAGFREPVSSFSVKRDDYTSARGKDVRGIRLRSGEETYWSGTSFASPKVAAHIALDKGHQPGQHIPR